MQLRLAPLWLLGAALGASLLGGCCGSSRHSLCYSYLKVSEPSQGLPQFLSMVHLDGHPIARYDTLNGMTVPLVPWMEAEEVKRPERIFRADLEWLSELSHQTGGFHTWQVIVGCELREDGSKGGFLHYGYNGTDFISFDKETLRWVAEQPQAQKVKEKWEEDPRWSQKNKDFLEKNCIEWLQRHLTHQEEALKKAEPPVGKVTHKAISDSLETLNCQAFGFYPKEIQATWRRDGEVWKNETLHRNVAPNSDGTYYVQLSIEIDPKERDRFKCHLEHEGLQEPLVLAFKKEGVMPFGLMETAIIVGSEALILFVICWLCRKQLHHAVTSYLDHRPLGKDENQSQEMLPPKTTSEGFCGQETQLREGENTPLTASPDASSDNREEPAPEASERGLEGCLEDAEATKPGMEGLEEEVRPGTSEGPSEEDQPDEHLAGEEKGEAHLQLEGPQSQPEAQNGGSQLKKRVPKCRSSAT